MAWFKKGSGTVAGTARRVLRTTVPDPFLNHARKINLGDSGSPGAMKRRGQLFTSGDLCRNESFSDMLLADHSGGGSRNKDRTGTLGG